MMKKIIVLLFLAISFVMMILISYMKFQTILYLESSNNAQEYYVQDSNHAHPNYNPILGF